MILADPFSECYAAELDDFWVHERTAMPISVFAVRLHATVSSQGGTQAILRTDG